MRAAVFLCRKAYLCPQLRRTFWLRLDILRT
nr:MAG TPA: hypothetical protein [Caudoviricetes sp.]